MIYLLFLLCVALGGEALLIDGSVPKGSTMRGTWRALPAGLHLSEPAPGEMNVVLPEGPELVNGVVHAHVRLGRRPHLTVLVRATAPADTPERLSGMGLTLRADSIQWERWDRGVGAPVAAPMTASTPLAGKELTLEVQTEGSRFIGIVRDAAGNGELARAEVLDERWAWGQVGLRLHQDAFTTIRRLSVAGLPLDPDAPRPKGNPDSPLGLDRFVLVSNADVARLPSGLRTKILGTWPYDETRRRALLLTPEELRTLQSSGVPHELRPYVPFWARDADLRASSKADPWADGRPDPAAPYRNARQVERVLREWARRHPDRAQAFAIGKTHQERPIVALRMSAHEQPDTRPAVLLLAALHGGDLLTTEYALDAIAELLTGDPSTQGLLSHVDLWVVPLANPDGHDALIKISEHAGRKNGRPPPDDVEPNPFEGVDLNRNFPLGWGRSEQSSRSFPGSPTYRGPGPSSEPETQAIMQLAQQRHFAAALIFNASGKVIVPPYTLEGVPNPEPNVARMIAEELLVSLPDQPYGQGLRVRKLMHQVDGAAQDYLRFSFGTVALSVQGPEHNPTDRQARIRAIQELRPLVPALLRRVAEGPRLSGVVIDPEGNPISAIVSTNQERWVGSESWASRTVDGRFHRLLPHDGDLLVTTRAEGFRPSSARATVRGVEHLRVVMEPRR